MVALENQTQHSSLNPACISERQCKSGVLCSLFKTSLLLICHRAVHYKQDNHFDGLDLAGTSGYFWLFHRRVDFSVNLFVAYLSEFIGDQCLIFLRKSM